ncbi:lysophospholipid acyltransferase family protein [Mucilaginibacter sp. P25]|uniref:1-acyl-sn-glycerol-3-phosphate acyltransferase n=1 Tax=Mucilaginibacter gossypii TaxID=551996 RepID=A0A1G7W4W4_9SPHI|nr:lysophospholipid acyltransferase family protein [Mucilaginibacter gossypii]SDG66958.1 1-acyl-sn-glycerol-3-phosphate acyltransferase [Mucilaginibacter gossypii]
MVPSRKKKFWSKLFIRCVKWWIGRNFKEVNVQPFEPRPGHSILLLTNHFSWWDGFIANRTAVYDLKKQFYIMMQQDQFDQHSYFRYIGAYSIQKGSRAILDSLSYSAGILNDPDNLIVIFPQGELYSNHETFIRVETGVYKLMRQIKGPCQVVYHCTLIDYFESLKPRAYVHLFDLGVAGELSFEQLKENINNAHQQALKNQINMEH